MEASYQTAIENGRYGAASVRTGGVISEGAAGACVCASTAVASCTQMRTEKWFPSLWTRWRRSRSTISTHRSRSSPPGRTGAISDAASVRTRDFQGRVSGPTYSSEALAKIASRDGSIGVAYTYTEPFIWFEYIRDAGKLVRDRGLVNVLVSNGYVNEEPLRELLPLIDAMNIDIKSMRPISTVPSAGETSRMSCGRWRSRPRAAMWNLPIS